MFCDVSSGNTWGTGVAAKDVCTAVRTEEADNLFSQPKAGQRHGGVQDAQAEVDDHEKSWRAPCVDYVEQHFFFVAIVSPYDSISLRSLGRGNTAPYIVCTYSCRALRFSNKHSVVVLGTCAFRLESRWPEPTYDILAVSRLRNITATEQSNIARTRTLA